MEGCLVRLACSREKLEITQILTKWGTAEKLWHICAFGVLSRLEKE